MGKVINFHKVTDSEWFESVICFLKAKYTMIAANDLIDYYYNNHPLSRKSCLITVDDGEISSYDIIYPILKKYQVPAVFFVSPEKTLRNGKHKNFFFQETDCLCKCETLLKNIASSTLTVDEIWKMIDKYKAQYNTENLDFQNMSLEQVLEIDREGLVTIGAHTLEHPFLARENDKRAKYEIETSVSLLEEILGHKVLFFAYPNGRPNIDFGEREMHVTSQTHVKLAFSTEAKDFSSKDNPYSVPRYGLSCGKKSFVFLKLLLGKWYPPLKKIIFQFNK